MAKPVAPNADNTLVVPVRRVPLGVPIPTDVGPSQWKAWIPTMLGGLLAVLGFAVLLESMVIQGPPIPMFHFRPLLLISIACVAYGYLMKPLGLILATVALVFISAFGGHEFKWKEVGILCVILVLFSVLVFVKGLTLPFPLCPDFIETCPIR